MFLDIANVLCIRDALWRHKVLGSASIMVGAGFSRNAEPLSSTAQSMPNWSQMAEALCHPLYPLDDARRQNALQEASGTSGFLRLAQEYQAAFGPSLLNDKIRNLVPDTDYRPGDLHKRLLRLPWADVFSTNWDTLLERACADVFDRSYDIVRTAGDIPFTARPRIVKLHGSFPGHDPFVFTEEEYRTYPVKFSPFVNLVQESMMETIFCLVGFSGDDPNFLHWSGWVRDQLGPGGPKIYLVGWLDLSIHRRRMLEARNVMPVDLSTLPGADKWPRDLRHRYASEWFIAALELGKPYPASNWPSPPSPPSAPPPFLGALPANTKPLPRAEPFAPPTGKSVTERELALRAAIGTWGHNRRLYPGWLVAPERVRKSLWHSLGAWISEFSLVPSLSALDRIETLSELAWRMDRALFPFPSDQEENAYAALESIDRAARTVDGLPIPDHTNWSEILRGAETLALSLARNARHGGDRARFNQALQFVMSRRDHDSELRNAIAYEECLWDLAAGDLTRLLTRLDEWMPAQGEALWSLRKAGLLAEMQDHERACTLLEATLVQIRRGRKRDIDDLVSLSLEGWALYLALAYSNWGMRSATSLPKDMPEPFERWRSLGIVDCDAFSDYHVLQRVLEANKQQQPEITRTRGFDLDQFTTTHHFAGGPSETLIAAYQMVLLAEITGIPPVANHVKLFEDGLRAAAGTLVTGEPWLASQLAIRIETNDKLLDVVFNRACVARLPEHLVPMLQDTLLKRISFGLTLAGATRGRGRDGIATVGSALEILSRVAVRLRSEKLQILFGETISYYRSPLFQRMFVFLGTPLANLLARILESLPHNDILSLLPALFALPLPKEGIPPIDEVHWRDPVNILPDWFDGTMDRTDVRPAVWEDIVSHLLIAARGSDAVDRGVAICRLFKLHSWKMLDSEEKEAFAAALWAPAYRGSSGIPQHTNLRPWVLLVMPEQQPNQAKNALLALIAEWCRPEVEKLYNHLAGIGELLKHFIRLKIPIELSEEVRIGMATIVGIWAEHRSPIRHKFERMMNRREQLELEALAGVAVILPHIAASDDLIAKIWAKAEAMDQGRDGNTHAFAVYPFLAQWWPLKKAELRDRLWRTLVSDDEDEIRTAVGGLYLWIDQQEALTQSPDAELDDLVREIGIGIAARRQLLLRPALSFARWVFCEGPAHLRELIVSDCDHGLAALLEEANYARSEQVFDVPAIRAACIRLASAMVTAGFTQTRGAAGWLTKAQSDPLPEVRNAQDRKADRIVVSSDNENRSV